MTTTSSSDKSGHKIAVVGHNWCYPIKTGNVRPNKRTAMNPPFKINLTTCARVLLALFALGCLIILFYFVPMWQAMQPELFLQWFSANGIIIGMIMLPLEMAPLVMCLVLLIKNMHDVSSKRFALLVNSSNLLILVLFLVFFLPANNNLMDPNSNPAIVPSILSDWKWFHSVRTMLAIASFTFSVLAFRAVPQTDKAKAELFDVP